ncbi:MAG: T9SS type A sorting domain-containing protein [Bacteroidales bacterium]|nr:T9SS type A sorting domain-containing protein [Bacteroidales bacterium]
MKRIFTLLLALVAMINAYGQWTEQPISIVTEGTSMYNNEAIVGPDGTTYFLYYHPNIKNAVDEYDTDNVVYEYRLQALDKNGEKKFGDLGILISDYPNRSYCVVNNYLYIDKDGNVVVAVSDARDCEDGETFMGLYAYKVSPEGEMLWDEEGITLDWNTELIAATKIIGLPDGSYVLAWMRSNALGSMTMAVNLQRLSADGKAQWGDEVNLTSESVTYQYPYLVDAGMNQFILVYAKGGAQDLYARKIDFDGTSVWGEDTRIYRGGWGSIPLWTILDVQPSGDGGVILGWNDDRAYTNVESAYMAYVTGDGKIGFSAASDEGDVKLSYDEWKHFNCKVMADPAGDGFLAFWRETDGGQNWQRMMIQKLSKQGELLYGDEGLMLFDFEQSAFGYNSIQPGKDGEAAFFYMKQNSGWGDVDIIYATLDTKAGELTGRTKLNETTFERSSLTSHICAEEGFWVLKWKENYKDENDETQDRHMVQRIDFAVDENENDTTSVEKNTISLNNVFYSNGQLMIDMSNDETAQIEIFDLVGRKVTDINNVELVTGQNAIDWTGEAGLYIAKLSMKNEVLTRKILVK